MTQFIEVESKETGNRFLIDPANLNDTVTRTSDEPVHPPSAPTDAWTIDELTSYATAHSVELDGATKKADILAAVHMKENV